jgi:hypothetical protein
MAVAAAAPVAPAANANAAAKAATNTADKARASLQVEYNSALLTCQCVLNTGMFHNRLSGNLWIQWHMAV